MAAERPTHEELSDPARAEALAARHPDELYRRRDFIHRTAVLAGAAGLGSVLPAGTLVAEAARRQTRLRALPSPRNMPIDTVVVLMMENRSFDHYLGWLPGADGKNAGLRYPDLQGGTHATHRLAPDWQGCAFKDPDHGWDGGRFQWNRGKNDGFFIGGRDSSSGEPTSDEFAIGYYDKQDVPFIPHAAQAFTAYDRYFCSVLTSTFPNRHYQWGAQAGGVRDNSIPAEQQGYKWETIFDRALAKGVTARYYYSDIPASALYGERAIPWTHKVEEFYSDCANGTLPNIAFVDPSFGVIVGEPTGFSGDEHPHGDIRTGQAFMSDVVHAFMESPQYRRGVLFINYDEWGGFFDHVPPPRVPDQRASRNDADDWGRMGFRVPAVAVGPFARGGRVSHATLGHESILKLISYRWGLGHLNRRHRYAFNIGHTLDFDKPVFERPELPDPVNVASVGCPAQAESGFGGASARPNPHDMVALVDSGYLDRVGFDWRVAGPEQMFRRPDSVRRALQSS